MAIVRVAGNLSSVACRMVAAITRSAACHVALVVRAVGSSRAVVVESDTINPKIADERTGSPRSGTQVLDFEARRLQWGTGVAYRTFATIVDKSLFLKALAPEAWAPYGGTLENLWRLWERSYVRPPTEWVCSTLAAAILAAIDCLANDTAAWNALPLDFVGSTLNIGCRLGNETALPFQ